MNLRMVVDGVGSDLVVASVARHAPLKIPPW